MTTQHLFWVVIKNLNSLLSTAVSVQVLPMKSQGQHQPIQQIPVMVQARSWGSMGKIGADIAVESWLFKIQISALFKILPLNPSYQTQYCEKCLKTKVKYGHFNVWDILIFRFHTSFSDLYVSPVSFLLTRKCLFRLETIPTAPAIKGPHILQLYVLASFFVKNWSNRAGAIVKSWSN